MGGPICTENCPLSSDGEGQGSPSWQTDVSLGGTYDIDCRTHRAQVGGRLPPHRNMVTVDQDKEITHAHFQGEDLAKQAETIPLYSRGVLGKNHFISFLQHRGADRLLEYGTVR